MAGGTTARRRRRSYITKKPEPGDIDLTLVLRTDFKLAQELWLLNTIFSPREWFDAFMASMCGQRLMAATRISTTSVNSPKLDWMIQSKLIIRLEKGCEDRAMIENERQPEQTRAAIIDLERGVAGLKRGVFPLNPARFALMAEAPVADFRELREQIDEYVGVRSAIAQEAFPEELETVQGLLREIDLDERSFIIRNPEEAGKEARCRIAPETDDLLEIAKECLDHPVIVRGTRLQDPTRKKTNPLRVEEIEVLDSEVDV